MSQGQVKSVRYTDILDAENARALIDEYSVECSIPEIGPTNPRRDLYAAMESTGLMQTFGAYVDGKLAGFATVLIYTLPHYGRQIATVESIFLAAGHRESGLGRELMAAVEGFARQRDCAAILYSTPVGSRLEQLLSLRKSCRRTNAIFCKSLT